MSWWEDWGETALNVMTGGIYGAAKAGSRAAADAALEAREDKKREAAREQAVQTGAVATAPGAASGARIPSFPGVRIPEPPSFGARPGPSDCCCDRFQLAGGLLLDKSTGRVWEYDKPAKAFVFLPMKPAAEHEKIAGILLDRDLAKITRQYAEEVLSTLPRATRAAQAAAFEKDFIEPLRASMLGRARIHDRLS
ncbi:MAG: hypothetical protein ABR576_00125 [Thermoanaerobaculia bacterium]